MDGTGIYYYADGMVARIEFINGKKVKEEPLSENYAIPNRFNPQQQMNNQDQYGDQGQYNDPVDDQNQDDGQYDDGAGEEEQPFDDAGEEEQPNDGAGEEEQPNDGAGEEEQPNDGAGEEDKDDGDGQNDGNSSPNQGGILGMIQVENLKGRHQKEIVLPVMEKVRVVSNTITQFCFMRFFIRGLKVIKTTAYTRIYIPAS